MSQTQIAKAFPTKQTGEHSTANPPKIEAKLELRSKGLLFIEEALHSSSFDKKLPTLCSEVETWHGFHI